MKKIKKNDRVAVIAGKSRGHVGVVLSVYGDRIVVDGAAIAKKHVRPNPSKNIVGGVEEKPMPIHVSNLALLDENGRPSRVGFKVDGDKKVRFFKTTGNIVSG